MKATYPVNEERLRELYIEDNLTQSEVADELNKSTGWVSMRISELELSKPVKRENPPVDEVTLRNLYLEERLTIDQIAERLDVSRSDVNQSRRALGITKPTKFETVEGSSLVKNRDQTADYYVYVADFKRISNGQVDRYVGLSSTLKSRILTHMADGGNFTSYKDGESTDVEYKLKEVLRVIPIYGTIEEARWTEYQEFVKQVRSSNKMVLGGK